MFIRLWVRALTVKRPQAILALVSLLVGAATMSMLLNLYSDVRRKMSEEFSAYGANVVLAPKSASAPFEARGEQGQNLAANLVDEDILKRLEPLRQRFKGLLVVPRLDVVSRVGRDSSRPQDWVTAVTVGTDLAAMTRLNPAWRITGATGSLDSGSCAAGANLVSRLNVRVGEAIKIQPLAGRAGQSDGVTVARASAGDPVATGLCSVASIVSTGAAEDAQIFLPIAALQRLTRLGDEIETDRPQVAKGKISMVELNVPGDAAEIESAVEELTKALAGSGIEVRPVRQIVYSEGRVLGTIRGLVIWLTGLILVIIALCVMATMTAIVLERQKDVAVMKALGASHRLVMELFLAEGAALGLLAGAGGALLGAWLASDLGQRLFGVALHWAWWTGPVVSIATISLALLATFIPVRAVRAVEPATVLKGA